MFCSGSSYLVRSLSAVCRFLKGLARSILYAGVSCEDLTPIKKEEYCLEETSVTLSYNYSRTATAGDEFYWYHQDTAQRPEFLLYISGTEFIKKADPLNTRISAKLNKEKTRVDLEISSADVTDSALYYCAVRAVTVIFLQI
uniref:Immunoglobulin V-set domain-containing protein n=1 Tax=Salmo trutta TaxID=8032 RepID=A0A674BFK9_SALTR